MSAIIRVNKLTKVYKTVKRGSGWKNSVKTFFWPKYEKNVAIDNISFEIESGKIVGLIGQNGAGKSTLMKMLVGILAPTEGSITVNKLDPFKDRKKNAYNYGVVFGQRSQLWWDIPVEDTFLLLKEMYEVSDDEYKNNMELFSDLLDIQSILKKPARQLSLGQRMRADLFAALLHNPSILFLDEPTIGLDVSVKDNMRKFIKIVNTTKKTTVILTTHDVTDIEELSDEIMVIDNGKIIYKGNIDDLKTIYGGQISIEVSCDDFTQKDIIAQLEGINVNIKTLNGKIFLAFKEDMVGKANILSKVFANHYIKSFQINETSLEEIIKNIYRHNYELL